MNCQHCQSLLLDHLYGLLDAQEAAALDSHLASCPACAAASAETARVQGLIARAAKSAFPATKFEPPVTQPSKSSTRTPAVGAAAVSPFPAGGDRQTRGLSHRVATIVPWAVAAAVLIAIPSTVFPVVGMLRTADRTAREAEVAKLEVAATNTTRVAQADSTKGLSDAEFRYAAALQAKELLTGKWKDEQRTLLKTADARRFVVDVQKPATVQPGAPNDFIVVVRDDREWERVGKLTVAEIHAVDASDAVIFTQPLNNEKAATNQHPIRLPASAWAKVKPNSELFLVVAEVDEKTQTRTERDRIRLAGPVFTTLLVTDKAVYRPGERLFFRSLTLDRITFKPPPREQILKYELLQSDGRTPVHGATLTGTTDLVRVSAEGQVTPMRTSGGQLVRGVGCGEFVLPADLPGGDYILRLSEGQHPSGDAATLPLPVTRIVKVQSGTADNYRKEIGFARESFAPGDTVEAWADVKLQDEPQPNVTITRAVADADEVSLEGVEFDKATDARGRAKVRFALPPELLDADVRLKVTFRTPLGDEFVAARVPVIGNRVKVEFFPECGDNLIAGVPCKVYVRATTPAGHPVNFRGVITDGRQALAKVESFNDPDQPATNRGLAAFTYTPQLGTKVWLKLESPSNVYAPVLHGVPVHGASVALLGGPGATAMRTGFMLPPVKAEGVVMTVLNPVTAPGEPIRLEVYSVGQPRKLVIGAYTRGKLSDMQKVFVEKTDEAHPVTLMAGNDPRGGVVRVTVFEEGDESSDLKPVAERLAFRKPGEVLNLAWSVSPQVATAPTQVAPPAAPPAPPLVPANSPLSCAITATDEKGNPAAAILYASVVNSGVALGKTDRSVRAHFLLAGEVKDPNDLEYADFLLTNHPKAAEALDLLLGTQGWRRFVEQSSLPAAPVAPGGVNPVGKPPAVTPVPPEVAKLMIQNGQYPTWAEPAQLREQRELYRKYASRYETATRAVAQAQVALDAAREESRKANSPAPATTAEETARRDADEKAAKAEAARESVRKFRANVWYGVAGLVMLALGCGLATVLRPSGRFPMGFSTLGSLALAAFLVSAGWDSSAKVSASDGHAMAVSERENTKSARPGAKTDDFTGDRMPEASTTIAPEAPAPPSGPKTFSEKVKGDTAPDKVTAAGDVTGNTSGKSPPQMGLKADIPKPPGAKESRPAFQPYSPPGIYPFGRPAEWKSGAKPTSGDPPPSPPLPAPQPLPVKPAVVAADPMAGLTAPRTGGWEPNRPNGVTSAELATGQQSKSLALRKRSAPLDVANEVESLKRDADRAAKWHASERETAIPSPPDTPFHFGLNAKGRLTPDAAGPLTSAEAYGVQVRGAANPSPPPPPLVVREFAAPRPAPAQLSDAPDPPDTVLWQPIIVLPTDGKAVLPFHVGSAPGGYEVVIAGHTLDGRLGSTRGMILVSPPKTLAPNGPADPGTRGIPGGPILPPNPAAPPPRPMP